MDLRTTARQGHVDIIACFAAPGKIMLHNCTDANDPNFEVTQDAIRRLKQETDAKGSFF